MYFQGLHKIVMDLDFQMHVNSPEHDYNPLRFLVNFHEKNKEGKDIHLWGYSVTSEVVDFDLFKYTTMAKGSTSISKSLK